ncbi:hypothetical protein EMIT0P260_60120 [Pseudomonas sp. IT-P260]
MFLAAFGPTMLWVVGCEYPLLRVLLITVPPLRRVTFSKRRKGNPKGFTLTFGPRLGSGSFAAGFIRGAAPTVCFAAPPLAVFGCAKRSLRSHPRINPSTQPADGPSDQKRYSS